MKKQILLVWLLVLSLPLPASSVSGAAAPAAPAGEAVSVIRQDCSGVSDCYTSLAAWATAYGGLPNGDLVSQDKIAVARIEGTWTQADTVPLELGGWTTDADHYVRIYTSGEARHNGTPGSGYRLQPATGAPVNSSVAHFRIEGLEIHSMSSSSPVYARPGPDIAGDIRLSHNLIHGNGTDSGSGIYIYDYDGALKVWNNVIYDVAGLGYHAGIQTSRGVITLYNNTVVDMIAGFAIRAESGVVVVKNNLTDAPADDFRGSFYPGSDFNASSDDTAPGLNSRRGQTFSFVDRAAGDYHLALTDTGARNFGADLSADATFPIADDVDGQVRAGGWDIGADEATGGTDSVPPIRSGGAPAGTLPSDTTEVTLSLLTNEAATCRYAVTPGVAYAAMTNTFSSTGGIDHTHLVGGLVDEQTYIYYVRCSDTAGSANEDDYVISFYIFSADTTPPVISNVQVINVSPYSAEITWETDEPCTSQVETGETGDYGSLSVISSTRVTAHSFVLAGLEPTTAYRFRVRSQDVAYNETVSAGDGFTTTALSNFYYVNQQHAQASDENPGTPDEPWLTIQHAADVAQPGDTILVYPGDYGRTAIRHGGLPGQTITFKGLNVPDRGLVDPNAIFSPTYPVQIPGNPVLNTVTKGFDLAPSYGVTVPVGYVRIEAMEVTAIGSSGGRGGFRLQNTDGVELVRNFIHDLNPTDYNYIGVRGDGHDNLNTVVKENVLYRVQGTGISVTGRNWRVEGNEVSHSLDANTDTGAHVGGDSDAVRFFGSGHVIRNNFFHDSLDEEQYGDPHIDCMQTFAVYPDSQFAHDILIEGNTCDNFGQMLMIEDNDAGNYVHHITFRNNILRGARAFAINGSCDHFTFANNLVADSNYGAIGLGHSPYLTMVNNIFYNNGSGAQIADEESKIGTVWDYNLHYPDFSWPPKQPGYDQHGFFGVDPQFLAPLTRDYHLQVNSPATDAGTGLPEFNYDKDFITRPQGAAWDIGPHESVPSLVLRGRGADRAIYLDWDINITLPATATWTVSYENPGSAYLPVTGILSSTRSYTLTGLSNGVWYSITLSAMLDGSAFLSDTVRVMPTDIFVYLPLVLMGSATSAAPATLPAAQTTGSVYYVAPGGDDGGPGSADEPWETLQHAADSVGPGDQVIVRDGEYAGFQLETTGEAENRIHFRAEGASAIINADGPTGDGIRLQNVSYVTVEGFTIRNVSGRGIAHRGATPEEPVHGLIIRDNFVTTTGGEGMYLSEVADSLVENNTIVGAGTGGTSLSGHGIYLANAGSDGTTLRGNDISGSLTAGVHFNGDLSIGGDGIISGLLIENNVLHDNGQNGLNMDGVQDSVVRNNIIYGNTSNGIRAYAIDAAEGPRGLRIVNNTIHVPEDGYWAIRISEDLGDIIVFNNILMNDYAYGGSIALDNTAGFTSANNAVVNCFTPDRSESILTLAEWQALGYDSGSFLAQPGDLFVNVAGADYRLKPGAAAIDAGLPDFAAYAAPAQDITGRTRPAGAAVDIGAYEFTPELELHGTGGDQAIYLTWDVNTSLPPTSTWMIAYESPGSAHLPVTGILSSTRSYTLTDLVNYEWYTVTLQAMLGETSWLSGTVRVMPTNRFVYLPLVVRGLP
ncbi:MAG: right-handed parallel beta-helix repeat-containing protein [Anaerolineae bacterium]|nr:right-handed parallel beta-helix repeat-containing protein [Anaerolineae bacterium]